MGISEFLNTFLTGSTGCMCYVFTGVLGFRYLFCIGFYSVFFITVCHFVN